MDKKEEYGSVNNQTDSWKFKFDKILNNSTYVLQHVTYKFIIVKMKYMRLVLKSS